MPTRQVFVFQIVRQEHWLQADFPRVIHVTDGLECRPNGRRKAPKEAIDYSDVPEGAACGCLHCSTLGKRHSPHAAYNLWKIA